MGKQSELAQAMKCNSAYLSRVMSGRAELSLEQGYLANSYLGHTETESEYFLLLIQYARAGTAALKSYFKRKLQSAREDNLNLGKRLKALKTITEPQQAKYYSAWYYSAIHVATSVSTLQTSDSLCAFFRLPKRIVNEALSFLVEANLVTREGDKYEIASTHIHLGDTSPHRIQHHTNWRMKTIEVIQQQSPSDVHYSSVVTLSHEDIEKAKEIAVEAIEKIRNLIKTSKEETVICYGFDFFKLE